MKTYLVTGAAGFIGANFIKYLLNKKYVNENIKVIVLDALTYAGNLGTIKDDIDKLAIERDHSVNLSLLKVISVIVNLLINCLQRMILTM